MGAVALEVSALVIQEVAIVILVAISMATAVTTSVISVPDKVGVAELHEQCHS